jgi:hypothetical protein
MVTVIAETGVTDVDIVTGEVFVLPVPQALSGSKRTIVATTATRR